MFEPNSNDPAASATRIAHGLSFAQHTLSGARARHGGYGTTFYKKWTLRQLPSDEQREAGPHRPSLAWRPTPETKIEIERQKTTDSTFLEVCRLYRQNLSVKEISRNLKISYGKTRKILVTAGEIETAESKMLADGMTIPEIAAALGKTEMSLFVNIPYQKCMYNAKNQTENAKRVERSRNRKKGEKL